MNCPRISDLIQLVYCIHDINEATENRDPEKLAKICFSNGLVDEMPIYSGFNECSEVTVESRLEEKKGRLSYGSTNGGGEYVDVIEYNDELYILGEDSQGSYIKSIKTEDILHTDIIDKFNGYYGIYE